MKCPRFLWIDYEEEEQSPEGIQFSRDMMELRCRKRPKLEPTTVKACGALPLNRSPNGFCYDNTTLESDGSEASCTPFKFNHFNKNSGLNDNKPLDALKPIGITSPKNPAKNGWLSHHNGYHGILLACSNGLTAPTIKDFKVNGFSSVSNHTNRVDPCCRVSSRRGLRPGRTVRPCGPTKIVNVKEAHDAAENLSPSSLEALDVKASQVADSPDVVAGSRSERALDAGVDLSNDVQLTSRCQQPKDHRKLNNLSKEKPSSSSSSVSSTSGRSCVAVVKKERVTCRWDGCGKDVEVDTLFEHIARTHVECQVKENAEESKFVCLWDGCKFYNRGSVLKTWLERHVHGHLGDKPYRCIVAQCRMRFASQFLLNRHINGHFSGLQSRPLRKGDAQQKKKKLRNARPCAVKTDDFFDSATMESIQNELVRCAQLTQVNLLHSGNTITFQSYTMAKRVDSNGHQETLLRWWPKNMLPDEWVPESQVASYATKVVPLSRLPGDALQLFVVPPPPRPHHLARHHAHGKHRRK